LKLPAGAFSALLLGVSNTDFSPSLAFELEQETNKAIHKSELNKKVIFFIRY